MLGGVLLMNNPCTNKTWENLARSSLWLWITKTIFPYSIGKKWTKHTCLYVNFSIILPILIIKMGHLNTKTHQGTRKEPDATMLCLTWQCTVLALLQNPCRVGDERVEVKQFVHVLPALSRWFTLLRHCDGVRVIHLNGHVIGSITWPLAWDSRCASLRPGQRAPPTGFSVSGQRVCGWSCDSPFALLCTNTSGTIQTAPWAAAEFWGTEMPMWACLECRRWGGWAGCVAAQLDVRLRGFDIVNHGAELVDESHQGHVHVLPDGLTCQCKVAVDTGLWSSAKLMKRKCTSWWGPRRWHAFLQHHCVQAEGLNH